MHIMRKSGREHRHKDTHGNVTNTHRQTDSQKESLAHTYILMQIEQN